MPWHALVHSSVAPLSTALRVIVLGVCLSPGQHGQHAAREGARAAIVPRPPAVPALRGRGPCVHDHQLRGRRGRPPRVIGHFVHRRGSRVGLAVRRQALGPARTCADGGHQAVAGILQVLCGFPHDDRRDARGGASAAAVGWEMRGDWLARRCGKELDAMQSGWPDGVPGVPIAWYVYVRACVCHRCDVVCSVLSPCPMRDRLLSIACVASGLQQKEIVGKIFQQKTFSNAQFSPTNIFC